MLKLFDKTLTIMKNKILLIPDIHGRSFWKDVINNCINDVDKVVFIGDIVDPYIWEGYTRKDAIQTLNDVIELKKNNQDKIILLWGNHDLHYLDRRFSKCSRYDSSNAWTISKLYNDNRDLWQMAYECQLGEKKYLFSHAGLMKPWYEQNEKIIGELSIDNLNKLTNFSNGLMALSEVSRLRGGFAPCGSMVWSDVNERKEYEGDFNQWDYQIFGHTQQEKYPIITKTYACIDCRQCFILNEDGTLEKIGQQDKGKKVEE